MKLSCRDRCQTADKFLVRLGVWVIYADTTGTTPWTSKTPLGRVHRPTGRARLRAGRSGIDPRPIYSSRLGIKNVLFNNDRVQ